MQAASSLALNVPVDPATIDTTGINLDSEPKFDSHDESQVVAYEIKADAEVLQYLKDFNSKKAVAAVAQQKRKDAFKPLLRSLCILKAIKLGRRGRDSDWGKTVTEKFELKIRTVDRWIHEGVRGDTNLPLWVVKKLMPEPSPDGPKTAPIEKIEIVPPSLQERSEYLSALHRLGQCIGMEGVWQVLYDAVVNHPALTEPQPRRAFLIDEPETVVAQMAAHQQAEGAPE